MLVVSARVLLNTWFEKVAYRKWAERFEREMSDIES